METATGNGGPAKSRVGGLFLAGSLRARCLYAHLLVRGCRPALDVRFFRFARILFALAKLAHRLRCSSSRLAPAGTMRGGNGLLSGKNISKSTKGNVSPSGDADYNGGRHNLYYGRHPVIHIRL